MCIRDRAHRLENLHTSGTRVVFSKCAELAAQGISVTGLTLGQPDFDTPQYLIDACKRALDEGKTRYTDGSGIEELKDCLLYTSYLTALFQHHIGSHAMGEEVVVGESGQRSLHRVALLGIRLLQDVYKRQNLSWFLLNTHAPTTSAAMAYSRHWAYMTGSGDTPSMMHVRTKVT